jgi:Domain of unknown function (DUF4124)
MILVRHLLSIAILGAAFGPAEAQVFKCVDPGGATTYQQTPCRSGQKGGPLEIRTDNGSSSDGAAAESEWAAAVRQRAPKQGMPQRLVEQALGPPPETRAPRPGERATVVWIYGRPEGMLHIAFLDGRVAAMHIEGTPSGEPPVDPAQGESPQGDAPPAQ